MITPEVSVVLPTYNRAALLPRALDSIISQTFGNWEIVLIDDGSTDNTSAVVERYAKRIGDRLVVIRQPNGGPGSARNRGIDVSRGRFVAFLDSDDEYLPTKLERQVAFFRREPALGLVYSDYAYVDLDGTRHQSAFDTIHSTARDLAHREIAPGLHVCGVDLFDRLMRKYFIATIVGMVRRDVLGQSIRFPEHLAYAEEWLFYLRVARLCRAGFVDEPLCLHHHTAGSLARTDTHRNTVGYLGILRAIGAEFTDLSRPQRRALRANLARTHRQVGYDASSAGRSADAVRHFASSLCHDPCVALFRELTSAVLRYLGMPRRDDSARLHASQGQWQRVR